MGRYFPHQAPKVIEETIASAAQKRAMLAEVEQDHAERRAKIKADCDEQRQGWSANCKALDAQLKATEAALDDLKQQGELGRISAKDYAKRLEELTREQAAAEETLESLRSRDTRLREMAADPIKYQSDLYRRYPALQNALPDYPSLP